MDLKSSFIDLGCAAEFPIINQASTNLKSAFEQKLFFFSSIFASEVLFVLRFKI